MGDIARCSLVNESLLYSIFGIDAEILIDHAWGYEPVGMKEIKNYKSKQKGMGCGQVLHEPYSFEKAKIIVREMTENLLAEMWEKSARAESMTLVICYDCESTVIAKNVQNFEIVKFSCHTSLPSKIVESVVSLYEKIAEPRFLIRKINIAANNVIYSDFEEIGLFDDVEQIQKEGNLQNTMLEIKNRFGKNALLKGTNLQEGATMMDRNCQIGGHKA